MPNFKKFNNPRFLLTSRDVNGNRPEIFISCQNRGSGKTYGYTYGFLEQAQGHDMGWDIPLGKFALICRWKHEIGTLANGMLTGMVETEYEGAFIESVVGGNGLYANIYFNKGEERTHVGYVLCINKSDDIKKISSMFRDVSVMLMDEFQCADMTSYCSDEINKFIRLHISVARGEGKSSRYVPVILLSNSVSIMNPYFIALKIHKKIQSNTKKLKGDGFVMERIVNPNAMNEQKESLFNRAFGNSRELDSSIDNSWLNDDNSCIEKPDKSWGRSYYECTLISGSDKYGVRYFPAIGYYSVSNSIDTSCQFTYNISINGNLNIPMLKSSPTIKILKEAFLNGQVRFNNLQSKDIFLDIFV